MSADRSSRGARTWPTNFTRPNDAKALAPAALVRQFDWDKLRLAYHLRATIGIRCRRRRGAADQRFQEQEELLSKHESFLHCLLFVLHATIWFDELVH